MLSADEKYFVWYNVYWCWIRWQVKLGSSEWKSSGMTDICFCCGELLIAHVHQQVREFSVSDVQPYSIRLVWQDESGQEGDMEVFPKNHQVGICLWLKILDILWIWNEDFIPMLCKNYLWAFLQFVLFIGKVWRNHYPSSFQHKIFSFPWQVPFSKMLTFFRREPFTLQAQYASPSPFPDPIIGHYTIDSVGPGPEGESQKVRCLAQ